MISNSEVSLVTVWG